MRLDGFLFEKGYFATRTKAQEAVKSGSVSVNGAVRDKPSYDVNDDAVITVEETLTFVSNGGYKLEKAIKTLGIDVSGKVFADIGASTGGFTDCLIKRGAKKVYAVDVGEGQLDESLYGDKRVVVMDNTNARYLGEKDFEETLDGVVVDCSFISLKLILPSLIGICKEGYILALIKPQFETGKKGVGKSGVITDPTKRLKVVTDVLDYVKSLGIVPSGIVQAPVKERKNIEYIVYLTHGGYAVSDAEIRKTVLSSEEI